MQRAGRISNLVNETKMAIDEAENSLEIIKNSLDMVIGDEENPGDPIKIRFTGSIQDAELAEALEEAYAKHGPKLASYIRELCLYPKPVVLPF